MTLTFSIDPADAQRWREAGNWRDELVIDQVDRWAASAPDRVCFVDENATLDYGELQRLSYRLANALHQQGIGAGDVVAAQLPNRIELAILHVALVRLGAVIALITPMSREREVASMLRTARPKRFFVPTTYRKFDYLALARSLAAVNGPPIDRVLVPDPQAGPIDTAEPTWSALLEGGDDSPAARAVIDALRPSPDAATELVFTSGTSGEPKGAIHTHNTVLAPQLAMARSLDLREGAILHMASPVTHQTGFLNGIRLPLQIGGCCVLQDRWSGEAFAERVEQYRIEVSGGSATFLLDLLRCDALDSFDLSSLRVFRCGGGPIPIGLVREAEARLPGLTVLRGWGQTENGVVTLSSLADPLELRAAWDGRVQPGMQLRIVGADQQAVARGEEGQVQVRGPFQAVGYANHPGLMAESTIAGWFDTGDLAIQGDHDLIRITGRAKDIIIRGGENVPVTYVENALFEDPRILEVAIVGAPDPRLGERAHAFVLLRPGQALSLDEMRAFLASRGVAAPYWPEALEIVDTLPRTANGKVRKASLREQLAQRSRG